MKHFITVALVLNSLLLIKLMGYTNYWWYETQNMALIACNIVIIINNYNKNG